MSAYLQSQQNTQRAFLIKKRLLLEHQKFGPSAQKPWRQKLKLGTLARTSIRLSGMRKLGRKNAANIQVKELAFAFPNLPPAFDGFRILHFTDLHIDGLPELADIIPQKLHGHHSDLCVITGDFCYGMPGTGSAAYPHMQRLIHNLNYPHPIIATLGNHDSANDIQPLTDLGIRLLVNESLPLSQRNQTIWLCGIDDPHGLGTHDLGTTLQNVPETDFKILLAHAPEIADEAAQKNIHLYLSGHTHGGQICLPGSHAILSKSRCPRAFVSGVWKHKHLLGYTSPGAGISSVDARFFCPPEVTIIELRRLHTNSC